VQIYANFQVNKHFPDLELLSPLLEKNQTAPRFSIYFFDKWIDDVGELNEDDPSVQEIVKNGGYFESVDLKMAKIFGIPIVHDGVVYQLADSLMVVVDESGVIKAIYRNAATTDLRLGMAIALGQNPFWDRVQQIGRKFMQTGVVFLNSPKELEL
jgi:hypothetical protein